MRNIDIKDLLPRRETVYDRTAVRELIDGKSVLITGAGGSIGSELARQIDALGPKRLTLVDNSEFNLYTISEQLPSAKAVYADVRQYISVKDFMSRAKPDVVFHAAALKHVPIVEANPLEGINTNIIGTHNVVSECAWNHVERMVMISTDKAVRPTSVMGATKRMAEMCCRNMEYSAVRFGNVMGSSGSVVPLFVRQIKRGGPVTITHEDIERYFMSVDEAVELVLQAATADPATYVLDMGSPMRIKDLATDMIRLSGLMPGEAIEIQTTGMRPGERLTEELFYAAEDVAPSGMAGIMVTLDKGKTYSTDAIHNLKEFIMYNNRAGALRLVWDVVNEA